MKLVNVANSRVIFQTTVDNKGTWTANGHFAYQTYPVGTVQIEYTLNGDTTTTPYGLTITR